MIEPVRRYADIKAIEDVLVLRALGADRFDVATMRACHPLDATDNHGTYQGLMHGFIDELERRTATGPHCRSKQHIVANVLVDFEGEDRAFSESHHVAHEIFEEERGITDYRIGGRYLDCLQRIDGRWMIQHRDIVYDWSRVLPATDARAELGFAGGLHGSRDDGDPLYTERPAWRGRAPSLTNALDGDNLSMTDPVQRLLDKQAITEVLYRRARAGDRGDAALAHLCYHAGATERHGIFDGPAPEFIDVVSVTRPKPGSPIIGMQHLITNVLVDFDDADHAFCESYHVAYVQMSGGRDAAIGGRYLDRFERRDERWAIVHRDVIFDWSRIDPETEKFWDKHPAMPFLFGRRDEADPLYTHIRRGQ